MKLLDKIFGKKEEEPDYKQVLIDKLEKRERERIERRLDFIRTEVTVMKRGR